MKTYAIIPFSHPPDNFVERVREIDPNAYISYEPTIVFVRVNSSPRYIAQKLGIIPADGNEKGHDGIVIRCHSNELSGYGNEDLWEFIRND